MNRTILYYPTIDIPTNSWLRHSLLYWDEVSSIVPKSWDEKMLLELSPEIHYLIDEGQFRPIKPEDLIMGKGNWEVFEKFQNEFKEIVSSDQFQKFINRGNFSLSSRIHRNKMENSINLSRIHANKTSDSLYEFLYELGLAKREENYEWIQFEKSTALLYMSLLAKYLADIDSNQTTIGTDHFSYEKFNFKRVHKNRGFPVISLNLDRVLPTPKDNVPLEKIIKFKNKRSDNLRHFKKSLSDFQTKISNSESQAELKEITIGFKESLINGVEDLNKTLKDAKLETGFKTFKSLINLKSPTTLLTVGTLVNSKIGAINLPIDWAIIGIATAGAIELTGTYIDVRNKERAKLRESSFSYLHYASKAGIINKLR
jgi:hypothetical protein